MTVYRCRTHGITLTIEGNQRIFDTPEGSLRGLPPCRLLFEKAPVAGTFGNCVIEEVGGEDVPGRTT